MTRTRFRDVLWAVPALGLCLVAVGAGATASGLTPHLAAVARPPAGTAVAAPLPSGGRAQGEPVPVPGADAAPVRLQIPLLRVDAPVVPVATGAGGDLAVPDDPHVVGWWQAGGVPGLPGAAGVLDGHVDTAAAGPGALFSLAALQPGDALSVVTAAGTSRSYLIDTVRHYPKAALPGDVFAAGVGPQLVLITCGGHFDRATRQYADNVVAVAHPDP